MDGADEGASAIVDKGGRRRVPPPWEVNIEGFGVPGQGAVLNVILPLFIFSDFVLKAQAHKA